MTWTEITDRDICVQGQENKVDCIASGTVYAGQGVTLGAGSDTNYIYVAAGNTGGCGNKAFGIAEYKATGGAHVAVHVGNAICWTRASGTGVAIGEHLYVADDGTWKDTADATQVAKSGAAIALTTQSSAAGLIRVKLL